MNNNTRKIVVLNDIKSPRIEQAIFILRDEEDFSESDAVSEAERIVSLYLENLQKPVFMRKKEKKMRISGLLCALCIGASLVVAAFSFTFLR
ncbi:MAG: hypothetical protein UIL37_07020 [Clostridia bacterium]|nr:hypothetical protein [Clostridia bacterium]